MRVMKRLTPAPDEETIYSRVSAGVVTYGDKINAIEILLLSKNYKKYTEALETAEVYAMAAGLLAATVLSIAGVAVPTFAFAIWQIGCLAAIRIAGAIFFAPEKNKDEDGN
jgi:hypothetical protein